MKVSSKLLMLMLCAYFTLPGAYAGDAGFRLGIRGALGLGGLHGHIPLYSPSFEGYAIDPKMSISAGAGLATAFRLGDIMTLALEPQYIYYSANGQFSMNSPKTGTKTQHKAGISLHSAELPMLARFSISPIYVESGAYIGANMHAPIYKDNETDTQPLNGFACGAAIGLGMEFKHGLLTGLRWQYSLREYVKNSNGYPWTIQIGITKLFLNKNGGSST